MTAKRVPPKTDGASGATGFQDQRRHERAEFSARAMVFVLDF